MIFPNRSPKRTCVHTGSLTKAPGMTIADRTGNGNDAKVIPYWKDATHVETYPKTDAELWPSGIEVPKVNQEQ